jgi:hypothetical protein
MSTKPFEFWKIQFYDQSLQKNPKKHTIAVYASEGLAIMAFQIFYLPWPTNLGGLKSRRPPWWELLLYIFSNMQKGPNKCGV